MKAGLTQLYADFLSLRKNLKKPTTLRGTSN